MELRDQHKQNMKNKFLSFILKYKYRLIYLILFGFISFFFNPKQKNTFNITDKKYFTAVNISRPNDFIDESDYYKYSD
jgi:hypothetical protein